MSTVCLARYIKFNFYRSTLIQSTSSHFHFLSTMASTLALSHSLLWAIFALLSISPFAASQNLQPYDCIDPQNPGLTSRVEIGQNTTVCLYAGPDGNWNSNIQYKRFSINLVADEFSNYKVPGCEFCLLHFAA